MPQNLFALGLTALIAAALIFLALQNVSAPFVTFLAVLVVICGALAWHGRRREDHAAGPVGPSLSDDLPIGFGRALLGKLPTPLIVIDARGRITYVNKATAGLDASVQVGHHFATAFRVPTFVETVSAVIDDGDARSCQFSLPGSEQILEAQVSQLPHGGDLGDEQQFVVVMQDRTEEIRAAVMRSDFIANASHEMRTPLASISGYIETLQGHAKDDPDARERFLDIMSRQATRMNRLVEDLLSLSRIEMNAGRKPTETCDLYMIVHEAAALLRPVAEKAGSDLIIDVPPSGASIVGDRDQLFQVASNLIDNAIKYGKGSPVRVTVADDLPKGRVGIVVEDNGLGIPPEHLTRLTERFYRVNVSESRNIGGTGLGLAIVKHILNRHSGGLEITSDLGQGSRFSFWVPCGEVAEDS